MTLCSVHIASSDMTLCSVNIAGSDMTLCSVNIDRFWHDPVQCPHSQFWHDPVLCPHSQFWHDPVQCPPSPVWPDPVRCPHSQFWHDPVQCPHSQFWHDTVQCPPSLFWPDPVWCPHAVLQSYMASSDMTLCSWQDFAAQLQTPINQCFWLERQVQPSWCFLLKGFGIWKDRDWSETADWGMQEWLPVSVLKYSGTALLRPGSIPHTTPCANYMLGLQVWHIK